MGNQSNKDSGNSTDIQRIRESVQRFQPTIKNKEHEFQYKKIKYNVNDILEPENQDKPTSLFDAEILPGTFDKNWKFMKKDPQKNFSSKTLVTSVFGRKGSGKTKLAFNFMDYQIEDLKSKGVGIIYPRNIVSKNVTLIEMPSSSYEMVSSEQNSIEEVIFNETKKNEILLSYTLSISNIILIVVNECTFEDVKLINRIKNQIQEKQELIIIHNLKDSSTIEECDEYISKITQVFKLEKLPYISMDKNNQNHENTQKYYFREEFTRDKDSSKITVVHVFYSQENAESGNYFNPSSKYFLQSKIVTQTSLSDFDLQNSLNSFLSNESIRFFNENKEVNIDNEVIAFKDKDRSSDSNKIRTLCYTNNSILSIYLEILSPNIKPIGKFGIERKKDYTFSFKANVVNLLDLINAEEDPKAVAESSVNFPYSAGDVQKKMKSNERANGYMKLEYDCSQSQGDQSD